MRTQRFSNSLTRTTLGFGLLGLVLASSGLQSCNVDDTSQSSGGNTPTPLANGEVCVPSVPEQVKIRLEPSSIVLPPCTGSIDSCVTRTVHARVEPDMCTRVPVKIASADPEIIPAVGESYVELHLPSVPLTLGGGTKTGKTTVKVSVPRGDGTDAEATLDVEVADAKLATCNETPIGGNLEGGGSVRGTGTLTGATIALPEGAKNPNSGSFLWGVPAFQADIQCGQNADLPEHIALGPAITFGPTDKVFQREIPISIPINPALMPSNGRLRHLKIVYSGPAFKTPRAIPVADPRIEKIDDQWAVTFKAPRLGTYQAFIHKDAGTKTHKRRLTHRAVIGISMGGAGTAMMGFRHHDLFDVVAPLGGPVDWTWLLNYIENNHLGGFRPIAKGTQLADIQLSPTNCSADTDCKSDESCIGPQGLPPGKCVIMPTPKDPYEHPSTFNQWWYEYPRAGNGGSFSRRDYAQIFRDLALLFGNPNGENLNPGGKNLPAGVHPDDPSQIGDHQNGECKLWLDPIDGPNKEAQEAIANSCPTERCAHTLTLQNYFDDEFNPDGTFPVITVCDGSPQNELFSPYANTWTPQGNDYPLEVALAVDYNGNGVRDEMEPLIRAGHERWYDYGTDGIPSEMEPGYQKGINDDPAGDDYNAQYNPSGTEGDMRRQTEEAFDDYGLDGVMGTAAQPAGGWTKPGDGYDVGEGDGQFTVSSALQRFWDFDSHSIVRGMVDKSKIPGGELSDEALSRLDVWTDGGTRDLFNFHVDAAHLAGTFLTRDRNVSYYTEPTTLPGLDPSKPKEFAASRIAFEDVSGVVMSRYGKIDPSPNDVESGSGQHVGSGLEITARLQSALYFIGSRWREPELRHMVDETINKPMEGIESCELDGNCTFEFTSSFGRTGPVTVTLPPGYAHADQQSRRYPVIYMLHGYGQTPEDLGAAILFLRNWMNNPLESMDGRLPKAIVIYVDGRCRIGANGKPECIRGTFFSDSAREDGVQNEQWWLELMDHIDQKYRTMGETTVDWTE